MVGPDGSLIVGIRGYLDGDGSWGTVDDFQLNIEREAGDTEYLEQQLAAAGEIDRDLYTAESLAALDAAVAAANVVLGAKTPGNR